MRTAFKILFLLLFVMLSPIFLLALALRMAPVTPASVKHELVARQIYTTAIADLQKKLDDAITSGEANDPLAMVAPFLRREITPNYLQNKVETFIDDTAAWFAGKGPPPVISFKDLKEKLMAQNRGLIDQIQSAAVEFSKVQEEAKQQAQQAGESAEQGSMPSFSASDIQKFIQSDFTIPVGEKMPGLKSTIAFWQNAVPVVGIILVLLLVGIIALSTPVASGLRWAGVTLFITALWNVPGIFVSFLVLGMDKSLSANTYAASVVAATFTPLLTSYASVARTAVFVCGVLAVGLIIISLFIKTTPVQAGKKRR